MIRFQTISARVLLALTSALLVSLLSVGSIYAESGPRDNDSNAVVKNGAYSKTELIAKLQNGDGVHSGNELRKEFESRGITVESIRSDNTVNGYVTKGGRVIVGDKTVATGAKSYGRSSLPGSVKQGNLYLRSTSVSFNSNKLPAYVHLENGKFKYAIIKSCGNMTIATPVVVKTKTVTITQPVVINVVQTQTQTQAQPVPVPPQPTPVQPALPKTGTSEAAAIGLAGLSVASWKYNQSRQRIIQAHQNTKSSS